MFPTITFDIIGKLPMSTSTSTAASGRKFRPAKRAAGKYHHGDLRRALLDAALGLVERRGPGGLTLREAARLAGVSHAAVYRHFADKTELLRAVAVEGMLGMRDAMRASLVGIDDPV